MKKASRKSRKGLALISAYKILRVFSLALYMDKLIDRMSLKKGEKRKNTSGTIHMSRKFIPQKIQDSGSNVFNKQLEEVIHFG